MRGADDRVKVLRGLRTRVKYKKNIGDSVQTNLRSSLGDEVPLPPGFRRVDWPGGQSSQAGSKQIIFAVDNLLQRNVVIAAWLEFRCGISCADKKGAD